MHHKVIIATAPALQNSSCSHPRYAAQQDFRGILYALTFGDVIQATIILLLTTGILVANMVLILVINSRRYSKYIHSQPRYLLTSLASNDLAMGLLVTPLALAPSVRHCWPYGELLCQIQALLRGALSQQSAVILICMAMDRYLCMLHPARYHKHSSKKGCVAVISLTWIASVTLFAVLVLPRGGYYFNPTGMVACEPFYPRSSLRILAACCFYFPTTMILMYCYGSAFHVNKLRLKRHHTTGTMASASSTSASASCGSNNPEEFMALGVEKHLITQERRLSTSASRTMAAMSLGFIVLVTPWSIQEVVAACTGTRAPPALDFLATWLALANAFTNPFLYWLLNNHFRRISKELLIKKFFCKHQSPDITSKTHQRCCSNSSLTSSMGRGSLGGIGTGSGCGSHPTIPPIPPQTCRNDLEGLSEKYWGEILERTLSSNSLQAMQKVYQSKHGHIHHHSNTIHHTYGLSHSKCNGMIPSGHGLSGSHHEMRVFERSSVPDL